MTQSFKLEPLFIFESPPLRCDHFDDIADFPGGMLLEYIVPPLSINENYDDSNLHVWRRVSKQFAAADLRSNKNSHLNLCSAFW